MRPDYLAALIQVLVAIVRHGAGHSSSCSECGEKRGDKRGFRKAGRRHFFCCLYGDGHDILPLGLDRRTPGRQISLDTKGVRRDLGAESFHALTADLGKFLQYAFDQKAPEELESLLAGVLVPASFACLSMLALRVFFTLWDLCSTT